MSYAAVPVAFLVSNHDICKTPLLSTAAEGKILCPKVESFPEIGMVNPPEDHNKFARTPAGRASREVNPSHVHIGRCASGAVVDRHRILIFSKRIVGRGVGENRTANRCSESYGGQRSNAYINARWGMLP